MDPKATLHRYLRVQRDQLLAKLDGLSERQVRWPMTGTGTNLLGLVKHVALVQGGYLGSVFGRPFPDEEAFDDSEVNSDMWATADESRRRIVQLYRDSSAHADATIEAHTLDSIGTVPWWPPERNEVSLHQVLIHLVVEVARHAGHADIVREMIDGRAGNDDGNLPDLGDEGWAAYRAGLEQTAERFG